MSKGPRSRSRELGSLALTGAILACSPAISKPTPPVAGVATNEHITASPKLVELDVRIRPRPDVKDPHLEIQVTARSDDLPRRWVLQRSWAGEEDVVERLGTVHAVCDGKPVVPVVDDLETHLGWTLPTRCKEATVAYDVGGGPNGLDWGYEYDVIVTQKLATAIAETALLMPDCPDDTRAKVRVRFDLDQMPDATGVYSLGDQTVETTTRGARHAYFAMGKFVTIKHQAGNLSLEARFADGVHFDTAAASRDLLRILAAESKIFADEEPQMLRLLVVGMPAAHGASHGTSLTSSAAIWVDGFTKWGSDQARLSAHEMFHLYNGQIIRRRGPDEQTYFLSEGFTEHYTDEVLLRAGIWSPREWFESVRFRVREYHMHPNAETPNKTADMKWGGSAQQLPYLRGSLIAAYVDRAIRKQSKGKRSLDDFMRMLLTRARANKPPLDSEDVLRLIDDEIGEQAGKNVRRYVLDGARIELPPDTFGACVVVTGTGKDTDLKVKAGVDLAKCVKAGR